jgi:hypothetical protein
MIFYHVQFELEHYIYAVFVWRKKFICGLAEVLSPQIIKRFDPQIANPRSVTFAEGPQI